MKKTITSISLLFFLTINWSFGQVIIDESFENLTQNCLGQLSRPFSIGCIPNWINTSGTTSITSNVTAFDGERSAFFYTHFTPLLCPTSSPNLGEGIAIEHDFEMGCSYTLSYAMIQSDIVTTQWILTNGLNNINIATIVNKCHSNNVIPSVPSGSQPVGGNVTVNSGLVWEEVEITFVANQDYDQLWLRISNSAQGIQDQFGKTYLDDLRLEKNIQSDMEIDFELPENACHSQPIFLNNQSEGYDGYRIEICPTDENGNCIESKIVSSGDWMSGIFDDINLKEAYQEWSNGKKMWCSKNYNNGWREYEVTLFIKNDCGGNASQLELKKKVVVSCDPLPDYEMPEVVCEHNPIVLVDNSQYYSSYQINFCQVSGPNDYDCMNPSGRYVTSGWIEGAIGSIDLAAAYHEWAITPTTPNRNWYLWCNRNSTGIGYYKVTVALEDDCGNREYRSRIITVLCEPCDLECSFDINKVVCNRLGKIEKSNSDDDLCFLCFEASGFGFNPSCNSWYISTDLEPEFALIASNVADVELLDIDYPGISHYTLMVVNCEDSPNCPGAIEAQIFEGNFCDEPRALNREGTSSAGLSNNISIFPNPFSDEIEIKMESTATTPIDYILFDVNGREVKRSNALDAPISKANQHIINTLNLESGVYFLQLKIGNLVETRKLVKF